MDDAQRVAFARDGFFVIRGCLSDEHVARLNAEYDARLAAEIAAGVREPNEKKHMSGGGLQPGVVHQRGTGASVAPTFEPPPGVEPQPAAGSVSTAAYRELIEPPKLAGVLEEILGDPRWGHIPEEVPEDKRSGWRLDHDNLHYQPPVPFPGGGVHGWHTSWHVTCVCEFRPNAPLSVHTNGVTLTRRVEWRH